VEAELTFGNRESAGMATFTDMPKLLLLLMVVATCNLPILISGALSSCALVIPREDCPTITLAHNYRAIAVNDSIRFRTSFGYRGKGLKRATIVIDPLPAELKVATARFGCQRKAACKAVKWCTGKDGKIVATVNNVRVLSLRIKFVNKTKVRFTAGIVTGTMYTSCGEAIPLTWDFGPVVPNVDPQGPEAEAPIPSFVPETPTPAPEPEPPLPPVEPETDPTKPNLPTNGPTSGQDSLPPTEATNPVEGENDFTNVDLSPAEGPVPEF
jgi:hypothetical protein